MGGGGGGGRKTRNEKGKGRQRNGRLPRKALNSDGRTTGGVVVRERKESGRQRKVTIRKEGVHDLGASEEPGVHISSGGRKNL